MIKENRVLYLSFSRRAFDLRSSKFSIPRYDFFSWLVKGQSPGEKRLVFAEGKSCLLSIIGPRQLDACPSPRNCAV